MDKQTTQLALAFGAITAVLYVLVYVPPQAPSVSANDVNSFKECVEWAKRWDKSTDTCWNNF